MNIAQNPNSELSHFAVNTPQVFEIPETFRETARQFQEAMMQYSCAIREFKTKLEVLNDELSMRNARNPIDSIESGSPRRCSFSTILFGFFTLALIISMESNLDDIAGVRVICSFVEDIYEISRMLERQDDVTIIAIKDYIKAPKENGYRSYHMIVEVPVFFSSSKKNIRVEVQIRTIAMDFWASLDHQLKYKKQLDAQEAAEIGAELKKCADVIAETDCKMLSIRQKIEEKHPMQEEYRDVNE